MTTRPTILGEGVFTVSEVCRVLQPTMTPRKVHYWLDTGLLSEPVRWGGRGFPTLLNFRQLLQIRTVQRLRDELAKTCLTRPRSEWTRRLEAADVPHAPVYDIPEVFGDPQVKHLGTFYRVRHPIEGEVWGIQPPVFFDGERPGEMTPPPVVGEHTDAILSEIGRDADSMDAKTV